MTAHEPPVRYCRCCAKNPARLGLQLCEPCARGDWAAEQADFWARAAYWLHLAACMPTNERIH